MLYWRNFSTPPSGRHLTAHNDACRQQALIDVSSYADDVEGAVAMTGER